MSNLTPNSAQDIKSAQKRMQSGDFQSALFDVDCILSNDPDNQEACYLAAVCARYLGKIEAAKAYLEKLKTIAPDFGRAFQEEGHLYRNMGNAQHALKAYQSAVRYNPSLEASWKAVAELHHHRGEAHAATVAEAQLARLNSLPRELLAATNHIYEGRILRAETLARTFLKANPHHVEGMRLLAEVGTRMGVHEDAEVLLEAAISLEPDNIQLRMDYIQVLRKRQKFAASLEQAKALVERDPDNLVFKSQFAVESMQSGDFETALTAFDQVLEHLPKDPITLTSRGHALKTLGRSDEAQAAYRAAIDADPLHGDAWYALANLKTYRFSDDELVRMQRAQTSSDLSFASRIHVAFALGKAFEDTKQYDLSIENYALGNELKRMQSRYTTEQMREELNAQKLHCTKELFERRAGTGHPAPDPIFIVGLPRAGSTLIEQILASHSQVDGTLELPNILSLAHQLRGRNLVSDRDRYPRILHELDDAELANLGAEYINSTRVHRAGAPFFTDKMPNNFRHVGLIHMILPNAKIIDARRNPMDCCWSGFKQLFAEGQEFSYGLEDIGNYYRAYVDLMAHWDDVLPEDRILRVQHEDVLEDLEGQVRRILEYCSLPFEDACVDFHKTERAVRTASSEQVRQPINKSGLEQWRPFEAHLSPLKTALGDTLQDYRG